MSNDNECPICLENYEEPATLSCLHTFCRKCLFRQIDAATGSTFTCSICGQCHIKNKEIPINQSIQDRVEAALRHSGLVGPSISTTAECFGIIFRSSLNNYIPIHGVNSATTIYELKKLIQTKISATTPTEQMRLVFNVTELQDGKTLGSYGICSGMTVSMIENAFFGELHKTDIKSILSFIYK